MQIDVTPVADGFRSAIGSAPLAVITIGLLVGPTVLYILFRLLFPSSRRRPQSSTRVLWACPNCRSVNESVHDRCYMCQYRPRPTDDLTVIDPVTARPLTAIASAPSPAHAAELAGPVYRGVSVGPGRPEGNPAGVGVPVMSREPSGIGVMAGTMAISLPGPGASGPIPVAAAGPVAAQPMNVPQVAVAATPGVAPAALPPIGRPVIVTQTPGRLGIAQAVGARRPFDPPLGPIRPRGAIVSASEPRITVVDQHATGPGSEGAT